MEEYFGIFASDPSKFEFLPGDVLLIQKMVEYVKKIADEGGENTNLKHFGEKKSNGRKKYIGSEPYTKTTQMPKHELSRNDAENNQLRCAAMKAIASLKIEQFPTDQHSFDVTNGNESMSGTIKCSLCSPRENKKVYYDKNYNRWVLANFIKHLKKKHRAQPKQTDKKNGVRSTTEHFDNKLDDSTTEKTENDTEPLNDVHHLDELQSETNSAIYLFRDEGMDELATSNNFEVVGYLNEMCSAEKGGTDVDAPLLKIYRQISDQLALVYRSATLHGNMAENVEIHLDDTAEMIGVIKIDPNSECLYSALSHQLFRHNVDSDVHRHCIKKLRHDVCEHINSNFEAFKYELQGRVYDNKSSADIDDLEKECKTFLRQLKKQQCWGGSETLKCVSELYGVNIAIFNEVGDCFMINDIESDFDKTLLICYRIDKAERGLQINRNHYDSIYDIDLNVIYAAAKKMCARVSLSNKITAVDTTIC